MSRRRIRSLLAINRGAWRHPWNIRLRWNGKSLRWEAGIRPGLVNGDDATVELPFEQAPASVQSAISHLPSPGSALAVRLSDRPRLPLTGFRAIGPDATPSEVSVDDTGQIRTRHEDVPLFFQVRGVGPPPTTNQEPGTANSDTRLLRACDVVLYKDRPTTSSEFAISDGTDGIIAQFDVTITHAANAQRLAYIRHVPKYTAPASSDPLQRLLGNWADNTRDELQLATIFLVSPRGVSRESAPDGSWSPYVAHRIFWNLHHGTNRIAPPPPKDRLILHTGLAIGAGDRINDFLLGQVNDGNSAASEFLQRNTLEGLFWSV